MRGGGRSLWRTTDTCVNVRIDQRLPNSGAWRRDNRMLCVPLMGNEDRLTPCLLCVVAVVEDYVGRLQA